jgi:alpha-L-rhamnosidase
VPNEVFATAFFAHSTDLVSRMARVLGREAEAGKYGQMFEAIRAAFQQAFVRSDGRIQGDTQAGYALALHFDLLPANLRPNAARHLADSIARYGGHLSTGIQSTHRALLELSEMGHHDLAWLLVTNRTFPSWGYMIENGATTIWERWDGYVKGRGFQDAGMNSFNHWAFGAVGEWMVRHILGFQPDERFPGWERFSIRPRPGGGVAWARGHYDSPRGRIVSDWRLAGSEFLLAVTVPPNTSAEVFLPTENAARVRESGVTVDRAPGVKWLRSDGGEMVLEVASGSYRFSVARQNE